MDVGCGTGIFVRHILDEGIKARGVEKGSPNINPTLEGVIDTEKDLFDLPVEVKLQIKYIVLLDVLEHMADPQDFLRKIYQEIPSCEQLIITVPARMEVWSNYDQDWGHFTRYNRPRLTQVLAQSGYTSVNCRYYFHSLYLVMLVIKCLGLKRKTQFQSPAKSKWASRFHRILGALTYLEARLLPGFLPGSSIVCHALRKRPA